MCIESRNLIDYFIVCGLHIKSGLEPNEKYGELFKEYRFIMNILKISI